ncbi:MAG TPA: hypothetical protein VIQ30_24340 [Pseudonocardia sp.]
MSEIQIGDTWRSKDKRDAGRTVKVESIEGDFIHVRSVRRSRVRRAVFLQRYELAS